MKRIPILYKRIAALTCHQMRLRKPIKLAWLGKRNHKRMQRILGTKVAGFCLADARIIYLEPEYCKASNAQRLVDLIVHEIVHLKHRGHGKGFERLHKKLMKECFGMEPFPEKEKVD